MYPPSYTNPDLLNHTDTTKTRNSLSHKQAPIELNDFRLYGRPAKNILETGAISFQGTKSCAELIIIRLGLLTI